MDISEANVEEHCHFNAVKKGKSLFSIFDQKRVEAVRTLQERCVFPSEEDFINTLEFNSIEGMDFGRRDVNIANEIYGYSKGAAMGRFKHPSRGVKMYRTNEDVATPVPPTIIEHYRDVHLDIDLIFVNKIPFRLAKSRDVGLIYCKTLLSKHDKRVQNGLRSRRFKVTSAFGDVAFKPLVK